MGVNSLSKTVTRRQRRDCDLNPRASHTVGSMDLENCAAARWSVVVTAAVL